MAEDCVYCYGHRPDPRKHIIQGTFEIDHSSWFCFSSIARSLAIRICSQKEDPSTGKGLKSKNEDMMQGKVLQRERKPIMKGKLSLPTRIIKFSFKFQVVPEFWPPGAFVMENRDKHEFFLKSASLHYIFPAAFDKKEFHFYCNSWVYPLEKTGFKRVFFVNELYLPRETPNGLVKLRRKELQKLRGGSNDERKPWNRIYQYDKYNDLGDPNNGPEYARPVLGGSTEFPYPRRLKTGRPLCCNDLSTESRPTSIFQTYVPPDERMSHEKLEELRNNFVDALARSLSPKKNQPPGSYQELPNFIKKILHFFVPTAAFSTGDFKFILSIISFFRRKPKSSSDQETHSFDLEEDMYDIFAEKETKEMEEWKKQKLKKFVPNEIFKEVVATTATKRNLEDSQIPPIIAEQRDAGGAVFDLEKYEVGIGNWTYDREFGRQLLAGTNPVRIRLLKELSPESSLWKEIWETERGSLYYFQQYIKQNRLFILEHHDYLMPYLNMINGKGVCAYATQTLLVQYVGLTIEPWAIVLSLPDSENRMVVWFNNGLRWELAKLHVASNDAAYHQLVTHWLHTHAVIEPFIIATRRQLSMMHPIHRLLDPHFKDTLHINALARGMFLNAGGILERTLYTGEFSMRLSSELYKQWRFNEQALPSDLLKRGIARKREELPAMVGVVLKDYPYADDGTEIWEAIETWVREYCKIFYVKEDGIVKVDEIVKEDEEIQAWWSEIRKEGHGDQKEGWYDLETLEYLIKALTTIIWITSCLHAAVNFGQYAYAGWPLNRPMLLRKFIPKLSTKELNEAEANPKKFVAEMMPEKFEMEFVIAVMDLLSRHTSDEVYLGQRPPENKCEKRETINKKFTEFKGKLEQIEKNIMERNKSYDLQHRWGYPKIPYKLLYPDTSKTQVASKKKGKQLKENMGITGMGIPNSISI